MNLKARLWIDQVFLIEQFAAFFPLRDFDSYNAFVGAPGDCIKSEPRTRVVMLERHRADAADERPERFIFKEYYYPLLPRVRTWLRHSKAEHEFRSLLEVANQGIKAAEAVAFGTRRTLLGYVRSCFIITRYVENNYTLEQWIKEADKHGLTEAELNWSICGEIGHTFRALHQRNFFLFTAKPRNILLQRTADTPEIIIIDLPYALRITKRLLARRAQALDLAVFLGNFPTVLSEDQKARFYSAYLPDPFGALPEDLERRVEGAIRWRRNETPISSLVHRVRSASKKWQQKRKRAAELRHGFKSLVALVELSYFIEVREIQMAISLL
jgi:tRNA A-37 threonylcarbamoyl transferase component Bud32